MPVVVVTDSTATLPPGFAERHGVRVVPLQVVVGGTSYDEGSAGASPDDVARALREKVPVSTSRATPELMRATYAEVAAAGADAIVSVHLSGEMSGTCESAQLAACDASVPVEVVDSRQVGPSLGFAVTAAVGTSGTALEKATAARTTAGSTTSLFYVDTLEYLRRGGRIGAAQALVGSALAVKPILTIENGSVGPLERVRTAGRALARLQDLAVAAASGPVQVVVSHLAAEDRAVALAAALTERLGEQLEGREVAVAELGAVLGAHVGPGTVAVSVAPSNSALA